jgi:hypothetical protein
MESKEVRSNINDRTLNHGPITHPWNARSNQMINTREEKGNQQRHHEVTDEEDLDGDKGNPIGP